MSDLSYRELQHAIREYINNNEEAIRIPLNSSKSLLLEYYNDHVTTSNTFSYTEEDYEEYLNNKDLSSKTVQTYVQWIKRISMSVFEKGMMEYSDVVQYQRIFRYLYSDDVPMSNKRTGLSAYKHLIDMYGTAIHHNYLKAINVEKINLYNYSNSSQIYREATQEELDKLFPYSRVSDLFHTYRLQLKDNFNPNIDIPFIILAFLKYVPPLRNQDYINTVISYEKLNDINHINMSSGTMITYEHKQKKKYGVREFELPDELITILQDYVDKTMSLRNSEEMMYLIPNGNDFSKPIKSNTFTYKVNVIFGGRTSKIGISQLRKIFVSELIDSNASMEERRRIAYIMNHCVNVANTIYGRFTKQRFNIMDHDEIKEN
jgi:integrase